MQELLKEKNMGNLVLAKNSSFLNDKIFYMKQLNIEDLLKSGAHFGHPISKWNPKFKPFIVTKKNGIYIIGFGKASAGMACELEKIIGHSRIASGLVITPPTKIRTKKINLFESSHPKLTEKSFIAGQKLIDYSRSIPANSLVICLNMVCCTGWSVCV